MRIEKLVKLFALFPISLIFSTAALFAQPTTYTYKGFHYFSYVAPYSISDSLNGSFTTANPLPPSLPFSDIHSLILHWSYFDGVQTFDNANVIARFSQFDVSTDRSGNIRDWYISESRGLVSGMASVNMRGGIEDNVGFQINRTNYFGSTFPSEIAGTWSSSAPCAIKVSLSLRENGTALYAQASSPKGATLRALAKACGFAGFVWRQTVTTIPCGIATPETPSALPLNLCANGTLTAPPPFNDPPPQGGYKYKPSRAFPFFYPWDIVLHDEEFPPGNPHCVFGKRFTTSCVPLVTVNDKILGFWDDPVGPILPGVTASSNPPAGDFIEFSTSLVPIDKQGNPFSPLYTWTWNTTFNGRTGGITILNRE